MERSIKALIAKDEQEHHHASFDEHRRVCEALREAWDVVSDAGAITGGACGSNSYLKGIGVIALRQKAKRFLKKWAANAN